MSDPFGHAVEMRRQPYWVRSERSDFVCESRADLICYFAAQAVKVAALFPAYYRYGDFKPAVSFQNQLHVAKLVYRIIIHIVNQRIQLVAAELDCVKQLIYYCRFAKVAVRPAEYRLVGIIVIINKRFQPEYIFALTARFAADIVARGRRAREVVAVWIQIAHRVPFSVVRPLGVFAQRLHTAICRVAQLEHGILHRPHNEAALELPRRVFFLPLVVVATTQLVKPRVNILPQIGRDFRRDGKLVL